MRTEDEVSDREGNRERDGEREAEKGGEDTDGEPATSSS